MFDKVMDAVGFDTKHDMLIANVVKCRPPENCSPRAEEAAERGLAHTAHTERLKNLVVTQAAAGFEHHRPSVIADHAPGGTRS